MIFPIRQKFFPDTRAFTLIELAMVIILMGLFVSLTIPRFRDAVIVDDLNSTVRKLTGRIAELRNQAVRNHTDYSMRFDLGSHRYWIEYSGMPDSERTEVREKPFTLPEDVRVLDIRQAGADKQTTGEVGITFYREGYIMPSFIHLRSEDGREFTLALRPFIGRAVVLEEYVDDYDL